MMPDASHWRAASRYDHVDILSGSGLAWEWLRRNEAYNEDFETFSTHIEEASTLTAKIRERWRLRFPDQSRPRSRRCIGLLAARRRYQRGYPGARAQGFEVRATASAI
ncbi:transcriptional regulator domain-containing protein [Novosphingobium fuchskuhlense]|uniref:transcriptional regulator domain-containing protein n=1 Tax=Novosphingobium fuchskuhlense TaxID=1117702 RepID=UPI0009E73843|nr:DUF6499 domain-containing protein [Novosphingobium fuchskuhlense]